MYSTQFQLSELNARGLWRGLTVLPLSAVVHLDVSTTTHSIPFFIPQMTFQRAYAHLSTTTHKEVNNAEEGLKKEKKMSIKVYIALFAYPLTRRATAPSNRPTSLYIHQSKRISTEYQHQPRRYATILPHSYFRYALQC